MLSKIFLSYIIILQYCFIKTIEYNITWLKFNSFKSLKLAKNPRGYSVFIFNNAIMILCVLISNSQKNKSIENHTAQTNN